MPGGQGGARRDIDQSAGVRHRAEKMGRLHSGGSHLSESIHGHAQEVPAVAPVDERFCQHAGKAGRRGVAGTLPAQERGADKQEERDQRRNRIARDAEEEFFTELSEHKGLAWTDGDLDPMKFL